MEVQKIGVEAFPQILLGCMGGLLLSSSLIFFFLRYQKRLLQQKDELRRAEVAHKELLIQANIRSQEAERTRISKDLHDHVGATLSSLRFLVSKMEQNSPPSPELQHITTEYKQVIDNVITDVRNISHELSPTGLAIWGLQESIQDYCDKMGKLAGLQIVVTDTTDGGMKNLPYEAGLALFRVVQELLTNTIKHAKARNVGITTAGTAGAYTITYTDDGVGLPEGYQEKRGIGMSNIESRLLMINASYEVQSPEGKGFEFVMHLAA